jgi:hypothetical protein
MRVITSPSGVRISRNWKDNIIIDRDNPVLRWKSNLKREQYVVGGEKLCRLGSENSEDALTWNYFRTAQIHRGAAIRIPCPEGIVEQPTAVLFWGRSPDTGKKAQEV